MSEFKVPIVPIKQVKEHPNADRLDVAVIGGYQCVVLKDKYKEGDLVAYVPESALLPEDLLLRMDLKGKLAGKNNDRVKAIRLRGLRSEGIVIPRFILEEREINIVQGKDVAEELNIVKWIPPVPVQMRGKVVSRPYWMPQYTDVGNILHPDYCDLINEGDDVVITHKIHGCNSAFGYADEAQGILVSNRRQCLAKDEKNLFWRAAEKWRIINALREIKFNSGADSVVLYGEIFGPGIQDLHYGGEELNFRAFDLMLNRQYVDFSVLEELLPPYIPLIDVLYRGKYDPSLVLPLAEGLDPISGMHVREGIVIRPEKEWYAFNAGRVIVKHKGDGYLFRKGGTEYT